MCGIVGLVGFRDDGLLRSMTRLLRHRGPDDEGYHIEEKVSLGFRRLSIIDLVSGNQPIANETKTVWVIFNGEIYNFAEIREWLVAKGHSFSTRTDTEVIVHAYEEEGIDCIQRFNGMFAFALWDAARERLFLVRDRLGKKPLHYIQDGKRLLFASEIKALLLYPGFKRRVNVPAIDDFLTMRYVPGSGIPLEGIHTLEPGSILEYHDGELSTRRYWSVQMKEPSNGRRLKTQEYIERFEELFKRSVKRRLVSDVPVGIYLSGGLDSTLVACTMRELTQAPLAAFSHGFDGEHDELRYARLAAQRYGLTHDEHLIQESDLDLLPKVLTHLETPIANSDIIGFYLLAKLAQGRVKVVLAGEGADELMGSYVHQQVLSMTHPVKRWIPQPVMSGILAPVARNLPLGAFNPFFGYPGYRLDEAGRQRVVDFLGVKGLAPSYFALNSLFSPLEKSRLYTPEFSRALGGPSPERKELESILRQENPPSALNRLIFLKYRWWLPNYCLLKEDKLSMSHGIEERYPFLDHELVEFMAEVPPQLKLKGLTRKYLLRQVGKKRLPEPILKRQKGPILVPIQRCFGRRFDALARDLLSEEALKRRGYFQYSAVQALFEGRAKNRFLAQRQLFALVVLELWHQAFVDKSNKISQ